MSLGYHANTTSLISHIRFFLRVEHHSPLALIARPVYVSEIIVIEALNRVKDGIGKVGPREVTWVLIF